MLIDAEKVREALNRRRASAMDNVRGGMFTATRNEAQAQAHALTLVLQDLGLEAESGDDTTPPPPSPTWPYVERFAQQMEVMLDQNRHKGDRAGWLAADPMDLWKAAHRNNYELMKLLDEGIRDVSAYDHATIARRAANVANFVMMVSDRCGALVLPGENLDGQPPPADAGTRPG